MRSTNFHSPARSIPSAFKQSATGPYYANRRVHFVLSLTAAYGAEQCRDHQAAGVGVICPLVGSVGDSRIVLPSKVSISRLFFERSSVRTKECGWIKSNLLKTFDHRFRIIIW
jgi:hypothetical protein